MSPERLKGEAYSFSSDIWSLGVILLEALLRSHPFATSDNKGFISLVSAITSGSYPQPPPDTPAEVADTIAQCLQVAAAERPDVPGLLEGPWLAKVARSDVKQPVFSWLIKRAASDRTTNRAVPLRAL